MGEKGAEVAPVATSPTSPDAAAIASLFGGLLSGVPSGTTATAPAQPLGELGSEFAGVLPDGLSATAPTLTTSAPAPTSPSLEGLKPSITTSSDVLPEDPRL